MKPLVVIKATLAPFLSSSAFVATVVPWEKVEMCEREPIVSVTARSGEAGVERTFQPRMLSRSSMTTSVNVPPISVATRIMYPATASLACSESLFLRLIRLNNTTEALRPGQGLKALP